MPATPARLDDFRINEEHLALLDDIEQAKTEGDYKSLENTRRWLKWMLTELSTIYDTCEQAVIATLPPEGAVVDGVNTKAKAGPVSRKFEVDRLVHRIVSDSLVDDGMTEDVVRAVSALLRVFPMDRPRITALTDLDIFWKDYVTQETTGRARIVTGEAA